MPIHFRHLTRNGDYLAVRGILKQVQDDLFWHVS